MPNQLQKHTNFLYATDLEPDDIVSLMLFISQISEQAKQSPIPLKIAFLVGEGNSAIKVARMNKLIEKYQNIGLLKNVCTSVIQGYSDIYGAQKNFKEDGKDLLSEQEIKSALQTLPDGTQSETKLRACDSVKGFLNDHANTLVISIKPMRELQDLYNKDNTVFQNHVLACTGSYNFRSICWSREKAEEARLQANLLNMCNAFSQSYIYETFSTTESNSTSNQNAPAFFNLVENAADDELLGTLRLFINQWKMHLLADDRRRLPELLNKLNDILSPEQKELFSTALQSNFTDDYWKVLRPIVDENLKKFAENKEAIDNLQSLSRLMGKWKNLTQAHLQTVNADPGLIAVLTGACDDNLSIQAAKFGFQGAYTQLSQPDENTHTLVYLPGKDTTLAQYLAWRQTENASKCKVVELKSLQENLLNNINTAITTSGNYIQALTMQTHLQKAARLVTLSQGNSLYLKVQDNHQDAAPEFNQNVLSPGNK